MVNLLMVGPSWVGDAVMMQTLLRRLKARAEPPRITVLAPGFMAGLLRCMPQVDEVIANPFDHGALKLGERWRFGRGLRGRFDEAIILPNSLKSALIPLFAGIARRIGFVGEGRWGLLTDARPLDKARWPRMVDRFNHLAEARGARENSPLLPPELVVSEADQAAVLSRLGIEGGKPAVALCVGAEYGPAKRWPPEHFAALARRLRDAGIDAWLLGSAKDASIGEAVEALAPGAVVNLCGKTQLADAVALLAGAAAVVSNDSGLMHVAAALGRPLVALYGSSSPDFTPPLSDRAEVMKLDLDCSPCFERQCPLTHFNCMRQLEPEAVFSALRGMLRVEGGPLL